LDRNSALQYVSLVSLDSVKWRPSSVRKSNVEPIEMFTNLHLPEKMYVENRFVFLEAAMCVLATVRPVPCQRKKTAMKTLQRL